MGLSEWLRVFRTLHEKAKAGGLSAEDVAAYRAGCDELSRALLAAQRLTTKPGELPRRALRVARALQVDLDDRLSNVRATTIDLGAGGFSALLARKPAAEGLRCTLRLPGEPPLVAEVRPVDAKPQGGAVRVSFAFGKLADADVERLERLVIDTALSQLAS